jgi:hypothetical protein
MTSGLEARGRFGKQDFVYLSDEDAYRCPAGEKLTDGAEGTPAKRWEPIAHSLSNGQSTEAKFHRWHP